MHNSKKNNKEKFKNSKDFDEEKKRNKAFKQKKRSIEEREVEEIEDEYESIYHYKNQELY